MNKIKLPDGLGRFHGFQQSYLAAPGTGAVRCGKVASTAVLRIFNITSSLKLHLSPLHSALQTGRNSAKANWKWYHELRCHGEPIFLPGLLASVNGKRPCGPMFVFATRGAVAALLALLHSATIRTEPAVAGNPRTPRPIKTAEGTSPATNPTAAGSAVWVNPVDANPSRPR
jgi:hypothetical protein